MKRPRVILAVLLSVFVVALCLGCDSETTAPKRGGQTHTDPIEWDGDKVEGAGGGPAETVSDVPSRDLGFDGFSAREHLLTSDLIPHDHTIIMEAILANVQEIAARLPQNQVASGTQILQATLAVPAVNRYTKSRIRLVLGDLARIEEAQDRMPDATRQAISEVVDRLDVYQTAAGMAEALQQMIDSGEYDAYEGLSQGMATGVEILRDGEKTVYAPRCLLNLKRLAQHDAEGAIAGAIGGLIVAGPPGAGVGALIGAAGASGSDLFGQLTGWW